MRKWLMITVLLLLFVPAALAEDALFPAQGGNGLWGYIDRTGEWVIDPQFTDAYAFRGDYAEAWMVPDGLTEEEADEYLWNNDCSGIIDRQGHWVLPPEYSIDSGYDGRSYGGDDTGIWIVTQYHTSCDEQKDDLFDEPYEGFFDIPSGCFSGLRWGSVWHWIGDSPLIPVTDAETWLYGYADRSTGELVIPYRYGSQDPSPFSEGVAPVAYEDEDGNTLDFFFLIDLEGNEIPLPEGIHAEYGCFASEGLIAVVDEGGLFGYADLQGSLVIEPQFSYAGEFEDGMAEVKLADGTSVYVDRTGAVLEGISPEDPAYMDNGLAWVNVGLEHPYYSNEWQLIDRADNVVSNTYSLPDFDSWAFDEGLQPVYPLDGGCVYLDETGAVALPGPYTWGDPFEDGLAYVRMGNLIGYIDHEGSPIYFWPAEPLFPAVGENGLWGYIDQSGRWAIEPQFGYASPFYDAPYAEAALPGTEDDIWGYGPRTWGIIDRNGQWVLPPEYDTLPAGLVTEDSPSCCIVDGDGGCGFFNLETGYFSGLTWPYIDTYVSPNGFIGVFDESGCYGYADVFTGEMVIPCMYYGQDDPAWFVEGVAVVSVDGEHFQIINEQNEIIPLPEGLTLSSSICAAFEGLLPVKDEWGRHGYIRTDGSIAIAPQFHSALDFSEGLAAVELDTSWGFIDPRGKVVLKGYQLATSFIDGTALVWLGDSEIAMIDHNGVFCDLPFDEKYTFQLDPYGGLTYVETGSYAGYINEDGEEVYTWPLP